MLSTPAVEVVERVAKPLMTSSRTKKANRRPIISTAGPAKEEIAELVELARSPTAPAGRVTFIHFEIAAQRRPPLKPE